MASETCRRAGQAGLVAVVGPIRTHRQTLSVVQNIAVVYAWETQCGAAAIIARCNAAETFEDGRVEVESLPTAWHAGSIFEVERGKARTAVGCAWDAAKTCNRAWRTFDICGIWTVGEETCGAVWFAAAFVVNSKETAHAVAAVQAA